MMTLEIICEWLEVVAVGLNTDYLERLHEYAPSNDQPSLEWLWGLPLLPALAHRADQPDKDQ